MAVTSPVSLTKVRTEFGGTNRMSAYVRGGAYVPNISANSGIPTVAAGMRLSQFLGATQEVGFNVSVSPGYFHVPNQPNGVNLTQGFTANITGGVGPFTYAWSWDSNALGLPTILNPTSKTASFSATASNRTYDGSMVVVVTDTGNGNQLKTASGSVFVQFGIPL